MARSRLAIRIAVVSALATAFWLQIGGAGMAAMRVAILAWPAWDQPIYQPSNMAVGALVALPLVAPFLQALLRRTAPPARCGSA